MVVKIWYDYNKVIDVIDSCQTIEQLKCAARMLVFWLDKHLDAQVYRSTFKNHIEKKFKELNGEEISEIPFKAVEIY